MALGSCFTLIKYLMFAFNFIFWLLGCSILGLGIWLRVDPDVARYVDHGEELNVLYILAYVFMAIGMIIMLIGFLGCCGAIRESQIMLGLFFILLFIIFSVLLGFGIWALVEKDVVKEHANKMLKNAVDNYNSGDNGPSKQFLDTIQRTFECCGANNSKDYGKTMAVPESCKAEFRDVGCEDKFFAFVALNLVAVAGVAIAVALVLILGMIFSLVLCFAVKDGARA